jgi:catechol 2,3-dioxygenase-like lactoylglutathione lyase family enzyme
VFDHVGIYVTDRSASERFYRTVLDAIGIAPTHVGEEYAEWEDFAVGEATADRPVTRRLHIGFAAPSREAVHAFHEAGVSAGHRDDGAPGPRPEYGPDYYGGFLLDPDGNSAEAVHHDDLPPGPGNIDHLWIRVADLDAAVAFYDVIAPHAGLRRGGTGSDPRRQQFLDAQRVSFSLVAGGEPTEHVHIAFPTSDDADVHAFHEAATGAGYRDNGAPGERPVYHPGYYGAFVLDPDGNNVEVVNHHRG